MHFQQLLNSRKGRIIKLDIQDFLQPSQELDQQITLNEPLLQYFQQNKQQILIFLQQLLESSQPIDTDQQLLLNQISQFQQEVQQRWREVKGQEGVGGQYGIVVQFFIDILQQANYAPNLLDDQSQLQQLIPEQL